MNLLGNYSEKLKPVSWFYPSAVQTILIFGTVVRNEISQGSITLCKMKSILISQSIYKLNLEMWTDYWIELWARWPFSGLLIWLAIGKHLGIKGVHHVYSFSDEITYFWWFPRILELDSKLFRSGDPFSGWIKIHCRSW